MTLLMGVVAVPGYGRKHPLARNYTERLLLTQSGQNEFVYS